MELAVLGVGAYLIQNLYGAPLAQPDIEADEQKMELNMLESPYQLAIHESRERGTIAPHSNQDAGRVPWSQHNPPYNVHFAGVHNMENATENAYHLIANAQEHQRLLVAEEAAKGRQHYARKRGQAVYSAFTRELTVQDADPDVPSRSTNVMGFSWLPMAPNDSDFAEAAAMGKAMPPDPLLFAPDQFYMTNSGMPFRNGMQQH
jgi:hypothetical protein